MEIIMYYYKDAIIYLIEKFPEIKPIYNEDIDYYVDLQYIFYESKTYTIRKN